MWYSTVSWNTEYKIVFRIFFQLVLIVVIVVNIERTYNFFPGISPLEKVTIFCPTRNRFVEFIPVWSVDRLIVPSSDSDFGHSKNSERRDICVSARISTTTNSVVFIIVRIVDRCIAGQQLNGHCWFRSPDDIPRTTFAPILIQYLLRNSCEITWLSWSLHDNSWIGCNAFVVKDVRRAPTNPSSRWSFCVSFTHPCSAMSERERERGLCPGKFCKYTNSLHTVSFIQILEHMLCNMLL